MIPCGVFALLLHMPANLRQWRWIRTRTAASSSPHLYRFNGAHPRFSASSHAREPAIIPCHAPRRQICAAVSRIPVRGGPRQFKMLSGGRPSLLPVTRAPLRSIPSAPTPLVGLMTSALSPIMLQPIRLPMCGNTHLRSLPPAWLFMCCIFRTDCSIFKK